MKESEKQTLINNKNLIVNKKDLKVIKNKTNDYSIFYNIKNTNIYLLKIINFNIIQLIYEINKDIFDEFNIEIINENEAIVYIIMQNSLQLNRHANYLPNKKLRNDQTCNKTDFTNIFIFALSFSYKGVLFYARYYAQRTFSAYIM